MNNLKVPIFIISITILSLLISGCSDELTFKKLQKNPEQYLGQKITLSGYNNYFEDGIETSDGKLFIFILNDMELENRADAQKKPHFRYVSTNDKLSKGKVEVSGVITKGKLSTGGDELFYILNE